MNQHAILDERVDRRIAAHLAEFVELRRELHRHPELAFKEKRTSALIADHLKGWGYEVTTGVGGTGVVGSLRLGNSVKALGIRADFDALPIRETSGVLHTSLTDGVMHACGHDGHTAILLAAARALVESRSFDGTLHLVFQPAEEIGAGARAMIADGLFERFPVDAIYGLHNWPGEPEGRFGFVAGPAMASVDKVVIRVIGKGGHGAEPHETVDPVLVSSHIVTALQSVVSRNVDPKDMGVVTVASIHGGGPAPNVIPDKVELVLTVRSFRPEVRKLLEARIPAIARGQAESFGATAEVDYLHGFPAVINPAAETDFIRRIALDTFGETGVIGDFRARTASEDFAFLLDQRPGSFIFIGAGDGPRLHSADYDFNDALIGPAATLWVRLVERFLA